MRGGGWKGKGGREREGYVVVGGAREQVQGGEKKKLSFVVVECRSGCMYGCRGGSGESKGCKKKVSF